MSHWVRAVSKDDVVRRGVMIYRHRGRQIAIFNHDGSFYACNNRCPHEGYPLSEGTIDGGCMLTCNWHNWKFDLSSGENQYGGDRLRVYPIDVRGEDIWVDLSDPPLSQQSKLTLSQLHEAFVDNDYARMARELARLRQMGADPFDAWMQAIDFAHDRLQFGWTHAFAGLAEWRRLYDECQQGGEQQLICLLEGVAHIADDVLREDRYPYTDEQAPFDHHLFLTAIEDEDEVSATAMVRGACAQGLSFDALRRSMVEAALAHYNDFGHSLIYVSKAGPLIEALGLQAMEPLLLSLTRRLVYARREDLIPEFRGYRDALAQWGAGSAEPLSWRALQGLSINRSLRAVIEHSQASPESLYRALLAVNAANMLHYDLSWQDKVKVPISDNVGWLDFTHGITFANAVRVECTHFPDLWPAGLLQMACFSGRNAGFTDTHIDVDDWRVAHVQEFFTNAVEQLMDHGKEEFIVSVHLLKTLLAARDEASSNNDEEVTTLIAAAINRFLHSPLKRKHVRRTVHQAIQFVAKDA